MRRDSQADVKRRHLMGLRVGRATIAEPRSQHPETNCGNEPGMADSLPRSVVRCRIDGPVGDEPTTYGL
jgi:hypothetical protein